MKMILTTLVLSLTLVNSAYALGDCSSVVEKAARKVSIALGMRPVDALGLANSTEKDVQAGKYTVYIGSHASYDVYDITTEGTGCVITDLTGRFAGY
jgi:hypothetical protein